MRSQTENEIISRYEYLTSIVDNSTIRTQRREYLFRTCRSVPKTGLMMVGWGGNNGSTLTASIIANKQSISWNTKDGVKIPNYYGSLTQSSTIKVGSLPDGTSAYIPFKNVLPMVCPNDLVIGGWDISSCNLAIAMKRAKVLDYDLQIKLEPYLRDMIPLPSIYYPDFIAANQSDRADNVLAGSKQSQLSTIRKNIRDFKDLHRLEKVVFFKLYS